MTRRFASEQGVPMPSRQACAGIIFLPVIQVIAIIAILIGLLLPAVQKVRESAAAVSASGTLYRVCQAAQTYRSSNGVYPSTLSQLGGLIDDPILLTGIENGYHYTITEATSIAWMAQAEPVVPGVTGSEGFVVDQTCNITGSPIPGADVQVHLMFSQILAFGAETIAGLLTSNPAEISQVRSSVDSPSAASIALQTFPAQTGSGEGITFSSMLNFDQYPEPLRGFLAFLPQAMHLGAGNEDVKSLPGVPMTGLSGPLQVNIVGFQGICQLTQLYETNPAVAHSMCDELSAAQVADQQGNAQARATMLNVYASETKAQTGRTLTQHKADVLMTLIKAL